MYSSMSFAALVCILLFEWQSPNLSVELRNPESIIHPCQSSRAFDIRNDVCRAELAGGGINSSELIVFHVPELRAIPGQSMSFVCLRPRRSWILRQHVPSLGI